ncbi:MAG: glycosyltransferase [Lachnospiraceae bacterium]|nr:glycosyltransferase [Lachnospiraceae bacterium]
MKSKRDIKTIGIFYHRYRNGGVERVISLLIPVYIEMGYRIVLITEEEPNSEDYDLPKEVERITIGDTWKVMEGSESKEDRKKQFKAALEDCKIDVIVYEALMSPLAFEDIQLINECGVYSVGCQHSVFCHNLLHLNWNDEQIKTCKILDKLIVLSEMEATYWKMYGVEATYIYNPPLEEVKVTPMEQRRDIVWIGRLEATDKRYMDVVEIMKLVVKKYPTLKLCIFGNGTTFEVSALRKAIINNGLDGNIEFKGYIKEVSEIYKTARVHLMTSTCESFSMAIYESKCAGIPLVTYNMPYLELLSEEKGYVAVKHNDYQKAADSIVEIVTNKDLEERLSLEAYESVLSYTRDDLKDRWNHVFSTLVQQEGQLEADKMDMLIMDTIRQHAGIMTSKYKILRDMCREVIDEGMIESALYAKEQGKGIVVYPYGKEGKRVEELLKNNGITLDYVLDKTAVSETVRIKRLNELEEENTANYLYIISSSNPMYYDEIREYISRYVEEENIYDMCPRDVYEESITEGLKIW